MIPEELRMLQNTVDEFVENEVVPLESEYKDELPLDVRAPLQAKLRDPGIGALGVPTEYGGAGLSTPGMDAGFRGDLHVDALAELDRRRVNLLLYHASDYSKEKHLYPMVHGEIRSAGAFSEPNAAGDLGGIETTADHDGDDCILNGTKVWIRGAHEANHIFVLTRMRGTPRHEGTA